MDKHTGFHFPLDIDKSTGRIRTIENDEAVKQSITVILKTNQGERLMRPGFGTQMNKFMFDNIDLSLIMSMSDSITEALELWEENIKRLDVDVMPTFDEATTVHVNINYNTKFSLEEQVLELDNPLTL